ncbi:MAG: transposase [Planctomycetes bacterium GWF2_42_9]|nr:MAG: transposase [Planctomycetes bacterium GWF2_42_9]
MNNETSVESAKNLNGVIKFDAAQIHSHLDTVVRTSVEETLNKLLDEEADRLCNAARYEHSDSRADSRAGHYTRKLHVKAGEINIKIPKLRKTTFETAIIERYKRRESSIEEAMIQRYLAGVSVRRVEDITEALWGTRVSPATVSEMNKKIYSQIELWRNRPLTGKYAYVYLDGIYLKRSWGGEVRNIAVLVAVGVDEHGFREILGICEGIKEDQESWRNFLRHLKQRGLTGVQLVISDKCLGLVETLGEFFADARWQRCMVHFYRNVFSCVPNDKVKEVAGMLKAIHAQESRESALVKATDVVEKLKSMRLGKASEVVQDGIAETLSYYYFPREHWLRIRTNNMLERIMKEIRRRTRVVGSFPDGNSALMLSAARLRHIAGTKWSTACYLNMKRLEEHVKIEGVAMVG